MIAASVPQAPTGSAAASASNRLWSVSAYLELARVENVVAVEYQTEPAIPLSARLLDYDAEISEAELPVDIGPGARVGRHRLEPAIRRMRLPHIRRAAPEVLATARAQCWEPA